MSKSWTYFYNEIENSIEIKTNEGPIISTEHYLSIYKLDTINNLTKITDILDNEGNNYDYLVKNK